MSRCVFRRERGLLVRCSTKRPVKACTNFRGARERRVHWHMPWRERPGPRDFRKFYRRPRTGDDSVVDGNVRAASGWCATGFVRAIRSEIVGSFQRTVEITCGCQALGGAMRLLRRTQLLLLWVRRGHGLTVAARGLCAVFGFQQCMTARWIFRRCEWAVPHLFSSAALLRALSGFRD